MTRHSGSRNCPDCGDLTRRDFLKTGAAAVAVGAAMPLVVVRADEPASTSAATRSETLVGQLYGTLTAEQKKTMAFPFDHPLRSKVDNNWRITAARVGQHFTADQQALIREIFQGLHSPQYAATVMKQVEHDNGQAGFGGCSIAMFGEPDTGKFEFVLSGRHVTRRCDGDSIEGAVFGGPIFYGHAAASFNEPADHQGNVYWYQAQRANELFQALDGKQRKLALRDDPRPEQQTDTVKLAGPGGKLHGIPFGELSADQRQLAEQVMADVLAPFREADVAECMKAIKASGLDKLHMAYYSVEDIGNDGVWDIWQIEGPDMVWYFRGAPHVHTWVHIRHPA
ncbi:MAG: DUF3500 domain-containing protein [Pirellulaceae bacterium]|nr:DUF3500 domain-containing protein [Pirellulaceae bacterium]